MSKNTNGTFIVDFLDSKKLDKLIDSVIVYDKETNSLKISKTGISVINITENLNYFVLDMQHLVHKYNITNEQIKEYFYICFEEEILENIDRLNNTNSDLSLFTENNVLKIRVNSDNVFILKLKYGINVFLLEGYNDVVNLIGDINDEFKIHDCITTIISKDKLSNSLKLFNVDNCNKLLDDLYIMHNKILERIRIKSKFSNSSIVTFSYFLKKVCVYDQHSSSFHINTQLLSRYFNELNTISEVNLYTRPYFKDSRVVCDYSNGLNVQVFHNIESLSLYRNSTLYFMHKSNGEIVLESKDNNNTIPEWLLEECPKFFDKELALLKKVGKNTKQLNSLSEEDYYEIFNDSDKIISFIKELVL